MFIGRIERFSNQEAKFRLYKAGGIPLNELNSFVSFVIVGQGAKSTQIYREAEKAYHKGYIIILTKQEFFDILNGKYAPHENPNKHSGGIKIPASEPYQSQNEAKMAEFLRYKRSFYLDSCKILGADGRPLQFPVRSSAIISRVMKSLEEEMAID